MPSMVSKIATVNERINYLIFLINSIGKSNIAALVDMTTPSTIGQLE
jgi:hypothetical protein